jgi:hypothetical protein
MVIESVIPWEYSFLLREPGWLTVLGSGDPNAGGNTWGSADPNLSCGEGGGGLSGVGDGQRHSLNPTHPPWGGRGRSNPISY